MTEIVNPVRAKALSVEVDRVDKYGKRLPQKTRNHITVGAGMLSGKEMERMIPEMAQEYGVSEDKIKLETYDNGKAPLEVNPRHRGRQPETHRVKKQTEVVARPFQRVRNVFTVNCPSSPEEWAVYVAEFEARKQAEFGS